MQQGVHVTAQSSVTCKDKRSYMGEYKAELKGPGTQQISNSRGLKCPSGSVHL